jgi:uncharacterized membrane protein
MKERNAVILIVLIFLLLAAINLIFQIYFTKFNFYKSEISVSGERVTERLYYTPDKDYHLLFRNFENPLIVSRTQGYSNYVKLDNVTCQEGAAYAVDYFFTPYVFFQGKYSPADYLYKTERNEYGCTYGNFVGFSKGKDYWIEAGYTLNPENIFKIKNKYYTKFVAYSRGNHKLLINGRNLIVRGDAVTSNYFLPAEYVIIYIQYNGNLNGKNVVIQDSFEFDNSLWYFIIFSVIPAGLFFLFWFFFGREKTYRDIPSTLSYYPQERKGWEVAAYFNPPFSVVDNHVFSAIMLDLKRRKILDLKSKDKDVLVKIIDNSGKNLDDVEFRFLKLLGKIKSKAKEKNKEGDFFNLTGTLKQWFVKTEISAFYKALEIEKRVKKEGKKYIDDKFSAIASIATIFIWVLVILVSAFQAINSFIYLIIAYLIISWIIYRNSAVIVRFKGEYYIEYQQWQAFKHYLKSFPSMRNSPPDAVRLWNIYLVYASALRVSKQVAKKFRDWGVINEQQYNTFIYVGYVSTSVSATSGASGGGGFGGAGGGGVGGGGGGGR